MRSLRKKTCSGPTLNYRSLECRRLLAGDVLFFQQGSFLRIVGDAEANVIEISQNDVGQTVVTGIDTTVNGLATPQAIDSLETDHLTVALREGSDDVTISGIVVDNTVRVFGEEGDDRITTDGLESRYLHIEGDSGADAIQLANSAIEQSAYIFLNDGDDVVGVDSFTTGRNFKTFGGDGDDTFAAGELTVGRKFRLNLGDGNDDVLLAGETQVARSTKIRTGEGDDFAGVLPEEFSASAIFDGRLLVTTGSGNDSVALDANVTPNGSNRIDGGSDLDAVENADSIDARVRSFETVGITDLAAQIDRVFSTLTSSDITLDFVGQTTVELVASNSTLEFNEGSAAIAVDDSILVNATSTQQFTGASVSIESFDSSQDLLSFADADGISGQLDNATGVLTLIGDGDSAVYQAALRSVSYENTSDNPTTDERQITFTLSTSDTEFTASRTLQIIAVGDAPIVDLSRNSLTVTEDETPIVLDEELELSDSDSEQFSSAIVSIISGFESGVDQLSFTSQTGIIGTFDPSTGALTFSGDATVEDYEQLLRTVSFDVAGQPSETDRTFLFTVNDGEQSGFDELELEFQFETT